MNREIKFRAWEPYSKTMYLQAMVGEPANPSVWTKANWRECTENVVVMQSTGLTDKNGKEIYEFMELDSKYEVIYQAPSYVLKDISTSDIIPLYGNKYEVTKEYTKI